MAIHYTWRGSTDMSDESGTAIFNAHGEQSAVLRLPSFKYALEIERMLCLAREEGRFKALQEIKFAVNNAMGQVPSDR